MRKEDLLLAVENARYISEVLRNLGLEDTKGNRKKFGFDRSKLRSTSFNRSSRTVFYNFRCKYCSVSIGSKSTRCRKCNVENQVKESVLTSQENYIFPPVPEIVELLQKLGSWSAVSKVFGIGENTLRKYLKRNGLEPKEIQYQSRFLGNKI